MRSILSLFCLALASQMIAQTPDQPIDWDKAKALYQRDKRGETLSAEEADYLNRAKALRGGGRAAQGPANQRTAPASLQPLCDMTADETYLGEDGGLYGKGKNMPPPELQTSAETALATIAPLDAAGKPAADGRIALVSISMSNATMEFSTFKQIADADERKSAALCIIDCAQGGQAMAEWVPADGGPWREAMNRLQRAGISPAQVQVAWIKMANKGPSGTMQDHLGKLEADTIAVLHNARARFPNLRIAYLGSRIWAGNAKGGLNPEPYAYESALAARHLIQRQMSGDVALAGSKSPLLLWGPYLWAEGEKGRKIDDLKWLPADFNEDGVHPSASGRKKVAGLLLDFFATNPLAKSWFTGKP
ncbi:MAG: hypothetical protein KDK97_22230 [Verrucomicrobiales bacterium]|nr:hypothetical protein [Verrucomicrobiales bacterium]MCP5559459.1 hypothetical protein [Verrucomicrobiaceae bacterium]